MRYLLFAGRQQKYEIPADIQSNCACALLQRSIYNTVYSLGQQCAHACHALIAYRVLTSYDFELYLPTYVRTFIPVICMHISLLLFYRPPNGRSYTHIAGIRGEGSGAIESKREHNETKMCRLQKHSVKWICLFVDFPFSLIAFPIIGHGVPSTNILYAIYTLYTMCAHTNTLLHYAACRPEFVSYRFYSRRQDFSLLIGRFIEK